MVKQKEREREGRKNILIYLSRFFWDFITLLKYLAFSEFESFFVFWANQMKKTHTIIKMSFFVLSHRSDNPILCVSETDPKLQASGYTQGHCN